MNVALLVTCLIDLWRPSAGFASVALLEAAGCAVDVPSQTCCGQPAYNSGDRKTARDLAIAMIDSLEGAEAVVVPSGSCAGMVKVHYPSLLADDPVNGPRAKALAARTYELTEFLADVLKVERVPGAFTGRVLHHDSCSCLREMAVAGQPRALLGLVAGAEVVTNPDPETCCGFGGTFAVKYPDISAKMVTDKAGAYAETGADLLVSCDMGCLMNIAGKLHRDGKALPARHIAEVLAGIGDDAPIGGTSA